MSEQHEPHEPHEPTVTDVPEPDQDAHEPVPDEADGGAPPPNDPTVDGEQQDEGDEDDGAPQDAEAPPIDAKELAKIEDRLAREDERHANRVSEIMGEASIDLIQCPLCTTVVSGWMYPPNIAPIPDQAAHGVRVLLGMPDTTQLEPDPDLEVCPVCKGKGRLATPSLVSGYDSRDCSRCGTVGYVVRAAQQANGAGEPEHVPIVTGPTVYQSVAGDPAVDGLRARGFTVIPPPPVGA